LESDSKCSAAVAPAQSEKARALEGRVALGPHPPVNCIWATCVPEYVVAKS
jgi:hypothetical protein